MESSPVAYTGAVSAATLGEAVPETVPFALELLPENIPLWRRAAGNTLRGAADFQSLFRAFGGVAVGAAIGSVDYPLESWEPMIATAALSVTDFTDGKFSRWATALDGRQSPFGGWTDHVADKIFYNALLAGMAVANFLNGRTLFGVALAAANAVNMLRDVDVICRRIRAEKFGIDTAAEKHGKIKAMVQFLGAIALTSPAMELKSFGWAATGLLAASTWMSVKSGLKYRRKLNESVAEADRRLRRGKLAPKTDRYNDS